VTYLDCSKVLVAANVHMGETNGVQVESEADADVRERVEHVLNRARPLLQMDGLAIDIVDVNHWSASVRLTGLLPNDHVAFLNFQSGLEEVLRDEIRGFRDLRLFAPEPTLVAATRRTPRVPSGLGVRETSS
jgi:Fe-S cluster biogenesis protein NfuA